MRRTLLVSATLACLTAMPVAYAQTSNQSAAPDGTIPIEPPATADTPNSGAITPRHHHHMMRARTAADDSTEKFAHEPGTGMSGPASMKASNTDSSNSRSAIAPHLPQPKGGEMSGPWHYLHAADQALAKKHTGEAQQALEMAETRLLDRSTPVDQAGQPDQGPVIRQVSQARQALGHGDMAGARAAIQMALSHDPHSTDESSMGMQGSAPPATSMSPASMSSSTMSSTSMGHGGMAAGQPTTSTMAPSGAGAVPGPSAATSVGGGPAGSGTADSAGGAK